MGSASRDVAPADPRGWRLGGSVAYCALTAARLGVRVGALVGADADARTADELLSLEEAGVELAVVACEPAPVFINDETTRGRDQTALAAATPIPPSTLPEAWRRAAAFVLSPVAGELHPAWADVPSRDALVAVGWQGLLRRVEPGRRVGPVPVRPDPLVLRADLAVASVDDLRAGGDPLDRLLSRPGQRLVITAAERGGLHVFRDERRFAIRRFPSVPARSLVDPTGAGDAFLAAWTVATLAGRASGRPTGAGRSLRFAAVVASLVVEDVGLAGVPDLAAVRRRVAELGGV